MANERNWVLAGGNTALDFANTVNGIRPHNPREELTTYEALISWSRAAGVIDATAYEVLSRRAASDPVRAQAILARARELREAIHDIVMASMHNRQPSPDDLQILNAALKRSPVITETFWCDGKLGVRERFVSDEMESMFGPIARSAVALLASDEVGIVRKCSSDDCGWLFLDTTKNKSRRWCVMSDCGNREKARQFRARRASKLS